MVSLAMLLVGDVEAVEVGLLGSRWMQKASERETERERAKRQQKVRKTLSLVTLFVFWASEGGGGWHARPEGA